MGYFGSYTGGSYFGSYFGEVIQNDPVPAGMCRLYTIVEDMFGEPVEGVVATMSLGRGPQRDDVGNLVLMMPVEAVSDSNGRIEFEPIQRGLVVTISIPRTAYYYTIEVPDEEEFQL